MTKRGVEKYTVQFTEILMEKSRKSDHEKNLLDRYGRLNRKDCTLADRKAAEGVMFTDIAEAWFTEVWEKRKQSTYVKYRTVYHGHVEKAFQGCMLSEINGCFVKERISDHLSDSMTKSIYCVLNQILRFASVRFTLFLPELKKPVCQNKNKPVEALTRLEQSKLIQVLHCETDIYKSAVILCLHTGLRLGELCALKWSDIDFAARVVMINRTVQRLPVLNSLSKTALVESAPKSGYSKRELPLPVPVLEMLAGLRNGKEYVFGGNKPLEPRTLQYRFKAILQEAGLAGKISISCVIPLQRTVLTVVRM